VALARIKWAVMSSHQPKWNEANLLLQAPRLLFEETPQAHQLVNHLQGLLHVLPPLPDMAT
jgi:hypothetical protein